MRDAGLMGAQDVDVQAAFTLRFLPEAASAGR